MRRLLLEWLSFQLRPYILGLIAQALAAHERAHHAEAKAPVRRYVGKG